MTHKLLSEITSQWLANELNLKMCGDCYPILYICSIDNLIPCGISFANKATLVTDTSQHSTVIAPEELHLSKQSHLISPNPRLDFIKTINVILAKIGLDKPLLPPQIHHTVKLGQNVVIEPNVIIGEGCEIRHNTVIRSDTIIGNNCVIQPGAVLGEEGFSFEFDTEGNRHKMPHLGKLIIGDNVQIGALSSICKGTLNDTIIKNNVKIDNLVHVGHNTIIEEDVTITACAEMGGVKIEKRSWIGPNTSIRGLLTIGQNSLIGIGSVVVKDVIENTIVAGNPAKLLKK